MVTTVIKAGNILLNKGICGLLEEMNGEGLFTLDFEGVDSIRFAELRALLNCRRSGKQFSIINASEAVIEKFEDSGVSSFINVTRKPKHLDVSKYQEFGAGYLSKAYNCNDGDSMLKIYSENVPEEVVLREKNVARSVLLFGINTPMVGSLYENGNFKGIDFERIEGKRSFSRIMSEEPERIDEMSIRFAHMCKQLHSTPCDTGIFQDRTIFYRQAVIDSDVLDEGQKAKIMAFIDSIPAATTCLHGDMQPSNLITNGKEDFWIDLSDFSYGYPLLDLGMWYFLSNLNTEELTQHIFHLGKAQVLHVWDVFVSEYFGADTPEKKEEVRHMVEPYAALHMLYLGTNFGFHPWMMSYIEKVLL